MEGIKCTGKRDKLVDCLRGYACLLVVFGHVIMGIRKWGSIPTFEYPLEKFIWTFHVSLFFFLSGYVYKITQKWKSKGTRTRFIAYKFIKVAVPYFSISIFYILINSLTAKTNTSFSVTDIFSLWKTPVAQYWYIYALFMLLLLYAVLSKVCNDWIITVFLVLLAYIRTAMGINVPLFGICLGHAFSFGVGVCLPDIQYFNRKKLLPLLIGVHVLTVSLIFVFQMQDVALLKDYMRMIGIITSVSLIGVVAENKSIQKFLLFINKRCFQIYLLHTIFTSAIRIVLMKLSISEFYIQTLIGMVVGIVVPILIGEFCSKTVLLNIFFFQLKRLND